MRVALDALVEWARRRERPLTIGVVGAAAALRALLVAWSPVPFGYVWDPYHAGVAILFSSRRLPVAEDCWACFHPPLYYLLGWPLYAAGHWLATHTIPSDRARWGRGMGGAVVERPRGLSGTAR